jgi:hypothetical protein
MSAALSPVEPNDLAKPPRSRNRHAGEPQKPAPFPASLPLRGVNPGVAADADSTVPTEETHHSRRTLVELPLRGRGAACFGRRRRGVDDQRVEPERLLLR